MKAPAPTTVDEYMAQIESEQARKTLSRLREIIRSELPDAVEKISYGIPGYHLNGYIAGFGAFKKHCSFFPGGIVDEFADELTGYKIAKGTIQFPHDRLLDEDLVRRILRKRAG